ncbi:MAG: TRAP transporter small permease [Defluviitaleaceae bacterium]|nr:TRAP transporter small permease [Defluviitaleaceae bacterium]
MIKRVLDIYSEILWTLSALCFFAIFIVNLGNIFSRTFLGFSVLWSLDFSMLMIPWSICMAMATAVYRNDHIVVTFIVDRLNWHTKTTLFILMRCVLLGICLILAYEGVIVAAHRMGVLFTVLRWPTGYAFAALPVFGFSAALFLLYNIARAVKEFSAPPTE